LRESVGAGLWILAGGGALVWSTRVSTSSPSRRAARFLAGFAVAAIVGQVASLAIERLLPVHTCHYLTLGLAMLGGAVSCAGRSAFATRWIAVRALAAATTAILLLPFFLGTA